MVLARLNVFGRRHDDVGRRFFGNLVRQVARARCGSARAQKSRRTRDSEHRRCARVTPREAGITQFSAVSPSELPNLKKHELTRREVQTLCL